MPRVRLIHWDPSEGREQALRLSGMGHEAEFDALQGPALLRSIRANPPDAFVIDLSRRPSHGREIALYLRSSKATRHLPLVFVDGAADKVAATRVMLPDATFTTWGRLKAALARAVAHPVASPVVPASPIASPKPLAGKLGIKPGTRVSVLAAPPGFADALAPLPGGAALTAKADPRADLFIAFVKSTRELGAQLIALGEVIDRQTLWLAWPKKTSGVKSDLDGNIVREVGLADGWVDFKVCSIDDTWSGLAFKRRR